MLKPKHRHWSYFCALGLACWPIQAEDVKPAKSESQVEKTSPWCQIQYLEKLRCGDPFKIKVKTLKNFSELKLMTAIHWFDQNEVYGGVLTNFDPIKNPTQDQWCDLSVSVSAIPQNAKFLVIVMHVSPTGQWTDLVEKFSTGRIQF